MTSNIDAARDDGPDRRRLADELLDELTAIKPRDRRRMFQAWQRCGVSIVQLSAANLLEAEGPMSMGRLAESLGISVASATGVVDRMEDRHLVVRRHDVGDRRLVIVHAAEGAAELFRTMEQVRRDHLAAARRTALRRGADRAPDRASCAARRPRPAGGRRAVIGLLRTYLRPYHRQILIVLVMLLIQAMATLYLPNLNADIIDKGIATGDTGYILAVGALMLLVTLVMGVAAVAAVYWGARVAMGFGRDLRAAIFDAVEGFSQVEINHFGPPSLITRNTNDVQQVQTVVFMGLTVILSAPMMIIGGIILAVREDSRLSLLLLAILPLMGLVIGLTMRRAIPLFQAMQRKVDRINQIMRETLSGVRVIRAFVRTEHEEARFEEANLDLFGSAIRVNRLFAVTIPVMTLIMNMSTVAVMWFGAAQVADGSDRDRQPDGLPAVPAADHVLGADLHPHVHPRAPRRRLVRPHPGGPRDAAHHPRPGTAGGPP